MTGIGIRELPHCPFWCEENVWQLCGLAQPYVIGRERHVLVVSNHLRRVAMWAQRAAAHPWQPVGWDYHVALLVREPEHRTWQIWDLDSTLGVPALATTWLDCSFPELTPAAAALAPIFRVVAASDYREHFSSDRSHMLDDQGHYQQPPPSWPAIVPAEGGPTSLARFIDMDDRWLGEVLDLAALRSWLAARR